MNEIVNIPLAEAAPIYTADEFPPRHNTLEWPLAPQPRPAAAKSRILVVDDQKLIADTLTEILNDAGFEAQPAYDGWSALEAAARIRPDRVLSDVLMPRMNGVELAIALRGAYPSLEILLFSGQAGISEILLDGRRRGYEFELIAKPIHPLKLIERLRAG